MVKVGTDFHTEDVTSHRMEESKYRQKHSCRSDCAISKLQQVSVCIPSEFYGKNN